MVLIIEEGYIIWNERKVKKHLNVLKLHSLINRNLWFLTNVSIDIHICMFRSMYKYKYIHIFLTMESKDSNEKLKPNPSNHSWLEETRVGTE